MKHILTFRKFDAQYKESLYERDIAISLLGCTSSRRCL